MKKLQTKKILSMFSESFAEQQNSMRNIELFRMKSYPFGVKNGQICERRSKSNYFGEKRSNESEIIENQRFFFTLADAYFKHYMIKCRGPMINLVWATLNAISLQTPRFRKSVIVFYTKFDFFSIFQPKSWSNSIRCLFSLLF